jgi:hypothetical protein
LEQSKVQKNQGIDWSENKKSKDLPILTFLTDDCLVLTSQTFFVGNSQFFATNCTTVGQYATTVCGSHSGAETMLVRSFSVRGLKGPFHKTGILFC